MRASDLDHRGCLNLVGAFWREVIDDLRLDSAAHLAARDETIAWLADDALTYDPLGLPVSFRAWCRFGGIDFDPDTHRATILSGKAPAAFRYEGE